jgi:alkylation response protein AidB-like acyl-CoA dehydrogenase
VDHDDPTDSPELREYRLAARAWLRATMVPLPRRDDGSFEDLDGIEPSPERIQRARALQHVVFDGGYAGITFPREYGGQGLTLDHERVFLEESKGYETPTRIFAYSLNILGATLVAFGNHEQKAEHLPRMLSGDEMWVQLLSEPSGGSDLAGLLTRATRDGDTYVLNGQKIWSTGAQHSEFAMCSARTRWDVPKHKGISVFIVDLRAPGVDIRPIHQINEGSEFCEEFLTDVRVPAANLVGDENDGWRVTRGLIEIEHEYVGRSGDGGAPPQGGVEDLVGLARARGLDSDQATRRLIADIHARRLVQSLTATRIANAMETGERDKSYGGVLKLTSTDLLQRRSEVGLAIAGSNGIAWPAAHADDPASESKAWSLAFLTARSFSIAGGTTEVQRNNVGERALGLPREPSVDHDVPFDTVRRSRTDDTVRRSRTDDTVRRSTGGVR